MQRIRITLVQMNLYLSNWKLKSKSDEKQASMICKAMEPPPFVKKFYFFWGRVRFPVGSRTIKALTLSSRYAKTDNWCLYAYSLYAVTLRLKEWRCDEGRLDSSRVTSHRSLCTSEWVWIDHSLHVVFLIFTILLSSLCYAGSPFFSAIMLCQHCGKSRRLLQPASRC